MKKLTREQKALRKHSNNVVDAVNRDDADFWSCNKALQVAIHYRHANNKK